MALIMERARCLFRPRLSQTWEALSADLKRSTAKLNLRRLLTKLRCKQKQPENQPRSSKSRWMSGEFYLNPQSHYIKGSEKLVADT